MIVGVCITEAKDAAEANAKCKLTPAYRQILREHPKDKWDRKYIGTTWQKQGGFWFIEFEVLEKRSQDNVAIH